MSNSLPQYAADHRRVLECVGRLAGFTAPVAVLLDEFYLPLVRAARKGLSLPVEGVLVRDWDPNNRRFGPGLRLGARQYHIQGISFVYVRFQHNDWLNTAGLEFVAVDRKDYMRLYRIAQRCRRDAEPASPLPVLPPELAETLWKNTIGYLDPANLRRIKSYGGRARRGVLLMGPPGNGKTMACRWIWEECRRRRWEWRLVTPDSYREARRGCNPEQAIRDLFTVERRGVVFFDDMDLALRDRETVHESDDQAVFLGALDGITVHEGVAFVFTTNCDLELIDRAFKRPGRIDLVLHFREPDATLRRQLVDRWHEDIRGGLDVEVAVASTEGYSFAEIEELKNLLIMHYMDADRWDWDWALEQFDVNRQELAAGKRRRLGFEHAAAAPSGNGRSCS